MAESIIVGDVVSHDMSLEWHEAVAVVQEVCTLLLASHAGAPDPAHIQLDRIGGIVLLPGSPFKGSETL